MKLSEAAGLLRTHNKFLVHNTEPYMVNSFLKQASKLFPDREVNKIFDLDAFAEVAMRGDLFSREGRILIFGEVDETNLDGIHRVVSRCGTKDLLILMHGKVLPKAKTTTLLKTECTPIKFEKPSSAEVGAWVSGRMEEHGIKYIGDVPAKVQDMRGDDMYGLENELDKLKHYHMATKKEITTEDCVRVLTDSSGVNVFSLVETFTLRRKRETFREFKKYPEESYFQLVSVLLTTLDKIHNIALLKEGGRTLDEVSAVTGIPKYYIRTKYYPAISAYGKGRLTRIREYLCDLDSALRLSRWPKRNLVECFFVKAFSV